MNFTIKYTHEFKAKIIQQLKGLNSYDFELFGRNLLEKYGAHILGRYPKSHDGGINDHSKLKIGLAYMNVAFQCKNGALIRLAGGKLTHSVAQFKANMNKAYSLQYLHFLKKLKKVS